MSQATWFLVLACLVALVNDGWSGRPSPFLHQLMLLPLDLAFAYGLTKLLKRKQGSALEGGSSLKSVPLWIMTFFEGGSLCGLWYESRHFAHFGYHLPYLALLAVLLTILVSLVAYIRLQSSSWFTGGIVATYLVGAAVSVLCFPLNYLRSDMLPVIVWADQRLAAHLSPYTTMHVGSRLYDFPYLPGMLVMYFPVVAMHLDPRWFNLLCVVLIVCFLYWTASSDRRRAAAGLIGVFLLSPFLQYRHDLYLQPHWLLLVGAVVLLQRGQPQWAAVTFGLSMAVYQLSWVLWPFLVLYAFRRQGWREALRTGGLSLLAMGMVVGPFASSARARIMNNTVGQWSRMPHALAEPLNLSYWVTYLVRPDQLRWVQLVVLTVLFAYCLLKGRCASLEDTLRCMSLALAIFIALNVLVDGYFYLTLLLLLLMYTMSATGIWPPWEEGPAVRSSRTAGSSVPMS